MLKLIFKWIPKQIALPLGLCGLFLIISYWGGMLLSGLFPMRIWGTVIDDWIPLRSGWVLIYVLSYLYWVVNYVLISRDHQDMVYRLVGADCLCKLVCLAFFIFLPTTLEQPVLEKGGLGNFLLGLIYLSDQPVNLFPSLHCVAAWLSFRPLLNCKRVNNWYKAFSLLFTIAIFFSTLYTKQHLSPDVLGGWLLAELSYDLVRFTPIPHWIKAANIRLIKDDTLK